MRLERTTIYILCSGMVALAGLVTLLAAGRGPVGLSVGTSLIAGGLTSIGFSIIRYFDDIDADNARQELSASLSSLTDLLAAHSHSIDSLRRVMTTVGGSDDRRIYNRNPREEVLSELSDAREHVELDVAALTGMPFCEDFLETLFGRGTHLYEFLYRIPMLPPLRAHAGRRLGIPVL